MLLVVCLCYQLAGVVVEGGRKEPVRWVVGNRVTYPLDVVEELALVSNVVVLRVDDAFDEVLGVAIDDERRRGRLFAILEGIGGLGLELGHMEHGVNLNRAGKSKREGHGGGLRNDGKGADLFL